MNTEKAIVDPEPPGTSAGRRRFRRIDDAPMELTRWQRVTIAVVVAAVTAVMIYLKW